MDQVDESKLSLKQRLKKLREELDKESFKSQIKNGNVVSTTYEPSIKYMYEGLNDLKNYPMGPFSNNTRHALVDSILNNVTFLNSQELLKMKTEQKVKELILRNKKSYENGGIEDELSPLVEQTTNAEDKRKQNDVKGKIIRGF